MDKLNLQLSSAKEIDDKLAQAQKTALAREKEEKLGQLIK